MSSRQHPYLQALGRDQRSIHRQVDNERVQQIISWHTDQIQNTDKEVACLHLGITANGQINKVGLGIEPAQASAMLGALEEVILKLREIAGAPPADITASQVIPINIPRQH